MSQQVNDFIMGGGAPGAKFQVPGDLTKGKITDLALSQQRDFVTKELQTWKDGSPMMQAVITLATDVRDPSIVDDDGKRRIFVSSKNMREAIRDAILAAGKKELQVGGDLAVQYTGNGQAESVGMNPPKLYRAEYAPPVLGAGDLLGTAQPSPGPQLQQSAPQPVQQTIPSGTSLLG